MDPSIVIKVKHSKTLRRFNTRVVDNELEFNLDGLRNKIRGLFNFNPDAEIVLTYLDEDNEEITLGNDEELRDVVTQSLNPLRIFVTLKTDNSARTPSEKSENVTTPVQQNRFENFNTAVIEFINSLPEPFSERLISSLPEPDGGNIRKALSDLGSTSTSSRLSGVVQSVTEKGLASLRQLSESSPVSYSSAQQANAPATENTLKLAQDAQANAPATENTLKLAQEAGGSNVQKSDLKHRLNENQEKVPSRTWASVVASNPVAITEAQSAPKSHETPKSQVLETGEVVNSEGSKKKAISEESDLAVKTTTRPPLPFVGVPYYHQPGFPYVSKPVAAEDPFEKSKKSPSVTGSSSAPNAIPLFKKGIFKQPILSSIAKPTKVSPIPSSPSYIPVGGKRQPNIFKIPQSPCPSDGRTTSMGIPLVDPSSLPSRDFLSQRNNGYTNGSGVIFHRGIRCDGCGVHPITGTRFKSRVKDDYDLCRICMSQMGIESDYTRIDNPMAFDPYKRLFDFPSVMQPSQLPQACRAPQPCPLPQACRAPQVSSFSCSGGGGGGVDLSRPKLDSRFVQDVTIFDGALMAPKTPFTKIWRMKNNGSNNWPMGTKLTWIGGDKMTNTFSVDLEIAVNGLPVEHELEVSVDFIAPDRPGRYVSYWRMNSPSHNQNFGQRVWVLIQVDASLVAVQQALRDFNLNNLPSNTRVGHDVAESSKDEVVHLAKSEFNFPITDNLLVVGGGNGGELTTGEGSPPVSYPMIDPIGSVSGGTFVAPPFNDESDQTTISLAPPVSVPKPVANEKPAVTAEVEGDNELEKSLLMELSRMGFKEVDLNKDVLRSNEFDLEKSLNDLCGVSEWDPILEELHEMGFYDDVMNKQLLEKNKGSVTQVVMDLLVEEN